MEIYVSTGSNYMLSEKDGDFRKPISGNDQFIFQLPNYPPCFLALHFDVRTTWKTFISLAVCHLIGQDVRTW
jgi:hypothetical protein